MDFTAFDTSKIDQYAAEAKASYGHTMEYREFEEKTKRRTNEETQEINEQMIALFAEFGKICDKSPKSEDVQAQVKKLQEFITENFYACSDEVLYGLGKMYVDDERFTANIDKAGGESTASFVFEAIKTYCGK